MVEVYISRPQVVRPPHTVGLERIRTAVEEGLSGHPRELALALRMLDGRLQEQVPERGWWRAPEETIRREPIDERNAWTVEGVFALGLRAAEELLRRVRLPAGRIDAIITHHASGIAMPGLDVHLHNALLDEGLRDDVRHIPLTQVGCAASAMGIMLARDLIAAGTADVVLVDLAEVCSTTWHRQQRDQVATLYKALLGDGGFAVLVSREPLEPVALRAGVMGEYVLPGTADCYGAGLDAEGQVFGSTPDSLKATERTMPHVTKWLAGHGVTPQDLEWLAPHPGGPAVLDAMAEHLGWEPGDRRMQPARTFLARMGNVGGGTMLGVLDELWAPHDGAKGAFLGVGPGFRMVAGLGTFVRR